MSTTLLRATYNAAARARGRLIGRPRGPRNKSRHSKCRRNLLLFLRTYLGARFPLPFSPDHLALIKHLQRVILEGGLQAVAMPRGSGKTTIFEGAALWAILYGHRRFVMVVAGDDDKAAQIVRSLKDELHHSDALLEDFYEACRPVRALEGIARRAEGQAWTGEKKTPPDKDEDGNEVDPPGEATNLVWTADEVRLPTQAAGGGSVIRGVGITGGIRGAKASMADGSQVRPDLVLVDDPQTDRSARSPSQVAARLQTILSTILGLAGPGEAIACLVAVTVIVPGDLAEQLLDRAAHPEWQGFRCRLMHSMPSSSAMLLWDEYTEILREDLRLERGKGRATAFYRANRKAMDDGTHAAWPERREPDEVSAIQHAMTIRAVRGTAAFASEYQNEPENLLQSMEVQQVTPPAVLRKLNGLPRRTVPHDATRITAAIDVQGAALYYGAAAWNEAFGGDVLTYGTWPDQGRAYFRVGEIQKTMEKAHPGHPWEAALFACLEELVDGILTKEWFLEDGSTMHTGKILIDASYGASTDTVHKFCRASRHAAILLPYFGRAIAAGQAPMDEWKKKPGRQVGPGWLIDKPTKRQVRSVHADANAWKSFAANRILTPPGAAASLSLYGTAAAEHRMFADQLSAEIRTRVSANGRTADQWRLKPNQDNHFFDCTSMCAIGASVLGARLDEKAAARRAAPVAAAGTPDEPTPPKPDKPPPRIRGARPGGWLDGFNVGGF